MSDNKKKFMCPECGENLEYMATWDGCLMFLCNKCLSTWQVYKDESGNEVIKRYFFG